MSISPLEYLRYMLDETRYLGEQIRRVSKEQFLQDATLKWAFVRSIEIIGEATKKLPAELRSKSLAVDWRAMAGMRDRLIHVAFSPHRCAVPAAERAC